MKFTPLKPAIHGLEPEALAARLQAAGEKAFRAGQVMDWLYKKRAQTWAEMTNLPTTTRQWLEEQYTLEPIKRVLIKQAGDVTEKLLFKLEDGSLIETVLIRAPQRGVGVDEARKTVCISTQVGCAYGCKFCASGLDGWKRDLSTGEIVAQLLEICRLEESRGATARDGQAPFDNIVVMGMGEPLANYANLLPALRALNASWGLRFGARRITVSTSGLVPQILKLAEEPIQFRLAISLHGASNDVREQIMPINRKYPLEALLPAAKTFAEKHGRMITLEYILIENVNDHLDQAEKLAKIARDLHAHVNLIPYNSVEGLPWARPSIASQEAFFNRVKSRGASVTIRMEKGHDINAACGQLRLQHERKSA